jgi:hypothetical protein
MDNVQVQAGGRRRTTEQPKQRLPQEWQAAKHNRKDGSGYGVFTASTPNQLTKTGMETPRTTWS